MSRQQYYRDEHVFARIVEYCGGRKGEASTSTAAYVVADGEATAGLGIPDSRFVGEPAGLARMLDKGADVFRSLWDTTSEFAIIDLDYQNQDYEDHALLRPNDAFEKLEPVFRSVTEELQAYGIGHIAVMTGQGYHFAWRAGDGSVAGDLVQRLHQLPDTIQAKYRHDHPYTRDTVPMNKGLFHAGMGLLAEYLAHRVLRRAYAVSRLPVVVTGLSVGSSGNGREAISIDLSQYGDPLYLRYTRCAFSVYQKPGMFGPAPVCLPRGTQDWKHLLPIRTSHEATIEYAAHTGGCIPQADIGTSLLLRDYLRSGLRCFHEYYASGRHDEPSTWPAGYDRLDLSTLSPCVAWPLAWPNDALAKPTNIQNVARVLVSSGWHPRSVAGLIRSKFERDYGWGVNWLNYDAATRADFYVRLFCGLIYAGLDDLRDFNCVSHQEKGFCPKPWCGFNLASYRAPLLKALSA